jgi:transketolase C-terminal domain/subunit
LQDSVPDETVLVRFSQRLVEQGLQEKLLQLVNRQLAAQGLIPNPCRPAESFSRRVNETVNLGQ